MRCAGYALAILLGLFGANHSRAADGWISFGFGGGSTDAQAKTLTQWINETCRPDEMSSIIGFSYQTASAAPINLRVFCRSGSSKLGTVKVARHSFSDEYTFRMKTLTSKEPVAVIGFDLSAAPANVPGEPKGDVLMIIKE